jgi:hypothetical protein
MFQNIGAGLLAVIIFAIQIGILIFVLDTLRRMMRALEQISRETTRQTEILNTLLRSMSANITDKRQDT